MSVPFRAATGLLSQLELLRIEQRGSVVHVRLNRPAKRNAISDALVAQLQTAFVNLPEDAQVVVLSGGGSARVPRLIGASRMADMMLTGRVYDAEEGARIGLSQYLVAAGAGVEKALALAEKVAASAPLSNFAVVHALPRIADTSQAEGRFTESLMARDRAGRRRRQGPHARLPRRQGREGREVQRNGAGRDPAAWLNQLRSTP